MNADQCLSCSCFHHAEEAENTDVYIHESEGKLVTRGNMLSGVVARAPAQRTAAAHQSVLCCVFVRGCIRQAVLFIAVIHVKSFCVYGDAHELGALLVSDSTGAIKASPCVILAW